MRIRSFRVRIALLSMALSGLVLAAFAVSAWVLVSRISLDRIDHEIRDRALPHLAVRHGPDHWRRFDGALQLTYGEKGRGSVILLVKGPAGNLLSLSPDWPQALSSDAFPAPDPSDPSLRPPPPRGPEPPPGGPPRFDGAQRGEPVEPPDRPPPDDGFEPPPPPGPPLPLKPPVFVTRQAGHQRWRLGVMGNPQVTLVMGMRLDAFAEDMGRVRNALLVALPLALLLIGAGGWVLAQRALRPVRRLAFTTERLTAKGLDQRIAPQDDDAEFVRLITVFNGMLDRLERSFGQAVRFSADAAHELKTPLTILQGELEQALQDAPSGSREQQAYNDLLEEVQRLKEIVRKLLLLSRADAGQLTLNLEPVNLSEAVGAVREDIEVIAPDLTVKTDLAADLWVSADADLLGQLLRNLASNAVKYNREGGWIDFRLRAAVETVRLTVTNTGDGIPPADRDRVFERFYRADPARGRETDGLGLGLSLAREIARAHQGDLVLDDSAEGTTAFTMTLPAASRPE